MDYKEEYEAMIKRCRELHESGNALTKQQMEIVCPQLKESDDDRIRKALVELVYSDMNELIGGVEKRLCVSWLEKQKFSKCDIDNSHAKGFNEGVDAVLYKPEEYGLQNPAGWREEDERMLERCISKMTNIIPVPGKHGLEDMSFEKHTDDELVTWIKSFPERFSLQPKQEWSEDDDACYELILKELEHTKESQPDYSRHFSRLIKWFTARFKSLRPQPKQEWSEEDEKMIKHIVVILSRLSPGHYDGKEKDKCITWLKALLENSRKSNDHKNL